MTRFVSREELAQSGDGEPSAQRPWLSQWLRTLLSYDGILPIVVFMVPALISTCVGNGVVTEAVAVAMPIFACIWRVLIGFQYISANNCPPIVKELQYLVFFIGVVFLALIDTLMILALSMPAGALTFVDYVITAIFYLIYLTCMAVSLYPGNQRQ